MPDSRGSDNNVKSGEAAPLLPKTSQHDEGDEETAAVGYLGADGASAPPPCAAPPPPPQDIPNADDNNDNKGNNDDNSTHQKHSEPATSLLQLENDDNASETQASLTQSNKSGKSRKKRKKTNDASSSKSSKSNKAKKKRKERPQKSIFHLLFDAVRFLAIIASSMMFTMQIIPLVILEKESTWLQIALRSYLAIFCFSFVLTESRIPFLERIVSPHNNWILRGFLYSFIGLIGMEQNLAVKIEDIAAGTSSVLGPDYGTLFATLFMSITSWVMIGVGALYSILGSLCMQNWYERLEKGHQEEVKKWKQETRMEEDFRKQQKNRLKGKGEWYDDSE
mmetsp:Transcript_16334/g.35546  ORF Transcript_16334/g.35546 Transcript_16334/m.35546 type:complete len:336 (-) Transcript_16334:1399-2406(-)|eukprot:CAMPEP_0172527492 /NCGR_PEP_ID=MMETSP1067-20121228/2157_1 /TAXON_ID=265564 ORGANISM="Thalassiosira punctigera, Strain Tpunct2005C2" /NCGR_SAMPLE_ID=MMETSP1067 /ASSEMBLY_ACC=CAM_ASM_000444 /LENGTH=335 /DNA_ID=CAMNT_0013311237 /DNA_START=108 /DNA_END=1115 /DNA_ORIENTATION=-